MKSIWRLSTTSLCSQCLFKRSPTTPAQFARALPRISIFKLALEPSRRFTNAARLLADDVAQSDFRIRGSGIRALESAIQQDLFSDPIPKESAVIAALQRCRDYAERTQLPPRVTAAGKVTPAEAILSLDDRGSGGRARAATPDDVPASAPPRFSHTTFGPVKDSKELLQVAFHVVSHPKIFITEPILSKFVDLALELRRPNALPVVFDLYAHKAIIRAGSPKPIEPNPALPKYAVPDPIAEKALNGAIAAKDMDLALDIISTTYGTKAYKANKIVRKVLPVGLGVCLAPGAVWVLADMLASVQHEVEYRVAVTYAFWGLLAYLGFTSGLGYIAMTTANDQMVRVTWLPGTPLRKRWLQEDERAAYDKVAQAWGFEDPNQRGFEEGPEWDLLRSIITERSMVLDNPQLLEGME